MMNRMPVATLLAGVGGLLALAEVVWVFAFLDGSSDGPAFAMVLVAVVLVPTLLVAGCAVLVGSVPRWTRAAAIAAVAVSGLAAAGISAGVFVGDDPTDPTFIHWVADVPLVALLSAVLLFGIVAWVLFRPVPVIGRIAVTAVTAIVFPVVVSVVLLTAVPLVMLVALGAPVALVTITFVITRRRTRQVEI